MSKKKRPDDTGQRLGVMLGLRIDPAISEALESYLANTVPRVSKTAAVEAALIEFLRAHGHWPAPSTDK